MHPRRRVGQRPRAEKHSAAAVTRRLAATTARTWRVHRGGAHTHPAAVAAAAAKRHRPRFTRVHHNAAAPRPDGRRPPAPQYAHGGGKDGRLTKRRSAEGGRGRQRHAEGARRCLPPPNCARAPVDHSWVTTSAATGWQGGVPSPPVGSGVLTPLAPRRMLPGGGSGRTATPPRATRRAAPDVRAAVRAPRPQNDDHGGAARRRWDASGD